MKTFKILKEDVKGFMPKLLVQNTFDSFEVRQCEVHTFAKFEISANLTKSEEDVLTWEKLKPYVYNIIKGNVLPKTIKVVFNVSKEALGEINENLSSGFLNLIYENGEIIFTTGTSTKTFTLNKEYDVFFEEYIEKFFRSAGIVAVNIEQL